MAADSPAIEGRYHPVLVEPRRTLVRRAGIAGAALLLLSAVTACGGTGPVGAAPVATVNGHRIYQREVLGLVDDQAAFLEAQQAIAIEAKNDVAIEGIDEMLTGLEGLTIDTASPASFVGSLVEIEILSGALRDAGVELTDADRDNSRQELMKQLTEGQITDTAPFEGLVALEIERNALLLKVQEIAKRSVYEESADQLEQLCVRLIATEDQASAEAAYERVVAGEDFSKVATEVSIDTTSAPTGGDIGCVPRGGIANVFGEGAVAAKPGDLLPPADGEGSWLFVQVDDVKAPAFEDVQETLDQVLPGASDAAAQEFLGKAFTSARVTIDPRYGTWNPDDGSVVPPVDPAPATTSTSPMLDPSAIDPSTIDPGGA